MPVPDPFREGMARGWKTYNGSQLTQDLTLEADVAIIGSGAGGGTTAEILSAAGYKVLLIEEGPLKTSSDFKLLEDQAYASLYQEGIGRMSKDGAITILQGRAVGGTTAEILSAAGYKVLLIEEGPLKTSSDFKLLEDEAYANLYQEGIGRMSNCLLYTSPSPRDS